MSATPPAEVLAVLARELTEACGDDLIAVGVHGSFALGDFDAERSDLDLVAVHANQFDEAALARLSAAHARVVEAAPDWASRIEVDHVTRAGVSSVVDGHPAGQMIRVSPGEPLHLIDVSRHYVLNWQSARVSGLALVGAPLDEVLPELPPTLVRDVVADHLRNWREWAAEMTSPGAQAYAVLAVSRAVARLRTGEQLSKRAAGRWLAAAVPAWGELCAWAEVVHLEGGAAGAAVDRDRASDLAALIDELAPEAG